MRLLQGYLLKGTYKIKALVKVYIKFLNCYEQIKIRSHYKGLIIRKIVIGQVAFYQNNRNWVNNYHF
mgnify:CR=1 FL=1